MEKFLISVIVMGAFVSVNALQCYQCDDCPDDKLTNEHLTTCGEIISTTTAPATTVPANVPKSASRIRRRAYDDETEPPTSAPETPAPTSAPETPAPTSAPITPAPTSAPETPAPTSAPETPAPTSAPETPAPTSAPITPAPTSAPITPAPTSAPETPAPTNAPITPAPTSAPETPAPTSAPETPAPTSAPITPAPTSAPETPAPTSAPETPAPTGAPETPAPTSAPEPTYSCIKLSYKDNGTEVVRRGCMLNSMDFCKFVNDHANETSATDVVCKSCTTDKCNSAHPLQHSVAILLLVFTLAVFTK